MNNTTSELLIRLEFVEKGKCCECEEHRFLHSASNGCRYCERCSQKIVELQLASYGGRHTSTAHRCKRPKVLVYKQYIIGV